MPWFMFWFWTPRYHVFDEDSYNGLVGVGVREWTPGEDCFVAQEEIPDFPAMGVVKSRLTNHVGSLKLCFGLLLARVG